MEFCFFLKKNGYIIPHYVPVFSKMKIFIFSCMGTNAQQLVVAKIRDNKLSQYVHVFEPFLDSTRTYSHESEIRMKQQKHKPGNMFPKYFFS